MGDREELLEPRYVGPTIEREGLEFEGVTFRVFPLRANPHRLERFCDDYLNVAIHGVGELEEGTERFARFRPAAPYVLLEVINYGRMSPKASNLGWLSQNEIVFAVPLEWYSWDEERWVFHDWATISPFIFVDDDLSTQEGREIYGWPKILASFEAETEPWMEDPRSRRRLLTLRTLMFSELFAGRELENRTLLQLEQRLPEAGSQWMPDLDYLARPLLGPGSAMFDGLSAMSDWALTAFNRWSETRDPGWGALRQLTRRGSPLQPQALAGNTINLKQFRGSEPRSVCYQALVNAEIKFQKFHAGGPLGDVEILRGDPSGGFRIRIHRHAAFPIIESLGLTVSREERGQGGPVAILRPQYPMWFKTDLRYESGRRIAWRIESEKWQTSVKDGVRHDESQERPPYNTSLGPVISTVEEPFDFWDATVHALFLKARHKAIAKLVDEAFGDLPVELGAVNALVDGREGSELYSTVLLQVTSHGEMSSQANDIGRWAQREVGFAVPVLIDLKGINKPFLALFWPFVFSDSPLAVRTDREVTGMPAVQARIDGGMDPWVDQHDAERRLLRVHTGAYPALHVGARREQRLLLEISGTPDLSDQEQGHHVSPAQGGLELDHLTLKQFRDAEDPRLACYQAVMAARTYIGKWRRRNQVASVVQDHGQYRVRIHEYESLPIVRRLGLCAAPPELAAGGTRVVDVELQDLASAPGKRLPGGQAIHYVSVPDRQFETGGPKSFHAFSMRVDLRHHLSRTLCWRGVNRPRWTLKDRKREYILERAEAAQALRVTTFGELFGRLEFAVNRRYGLGSHASSSSSLSSSSYSAEAAPEPALPKKKRPARKARAKRMRRPAKKGKS